MPEGKCSVMDLSIVVVNWNTSDLLAQCLRSVYDTTGNLDFEVIVVDNASTDGSPEMVRQEFPDATLIANTENLGFAKANNQAILRSLGRYVLLLNSDAFVQENTVEHVVAFMDAHPEAGMAGCKLLYEDGRLQYSCTKFPTLFTELCIATQLDRLFPKSRSCGRYPMKYWDLDVREVDVILGAFMLVRAAAIDEVGLMDERYFMYSEEVDWCYRFKEKGWKIYFYPHSEAIHLWGGSTGRIRIEMLTQMYKSRIAFFRKHYGRRSVTLLKLLIGLGCLLRIGPGALYYFSRAGSPQIRQKYRAFWHLLRALPAL